MSSTLKKVLPLTLRLSGSSSCAFLAIFFFAIICPLFLSVCSLTDAQEVVTTTATKNNANNVTVLSSKETTQPRPSLPQLNGDHFRITVVEDEYLIKFHEENDNHQPNGLSFSGYFIDILKSISVPYRGNFTYELLPPSGKGSLCSHPPPQQQQQPTKTTTDNVSSVMPEINDNNKSLYSSYYHSQFLCGESDVNDIPKSDYTTDMYLSSYYITHKRLLKNYFTSPFDPPRTSALIMAGTATYVRSIPDFVYQQKNGVQSKPACVYQQTEYVTFLTKAFPELKLVTIHFSYDATLQALRDGICDVIIEPTPTAFAFISRAYDDGNCLINEQPIGVIGDALNFGMSQFAIGVRNDLPIEFIDTWNYWANVLMECPPHETNIDFHENSNDHNDGLYCDGDNFATLYENMFGTGYECGYIQFPPLPNKNRFKASLVTGIVVGSIIIVIIICYIIYSIRLKSKKYYIKKRFVQQIAKDIKIAPCPGQIPVDKLAKEIQHISNNNKTCITKENLWDWLDQNQLRLVSEKDFDLLWTGIDIEGKGRVDPIEFFVFLGKCGSEFKEVYTEQETKVRHMSKREQIFSAAQGLSNLTREFCVKEEEEEEENLTKELFIKEEDSNNNDGNSSDGPELTEKERSERLLLGYEDNG